jgi:tetratricopeptide (TPR) repeat protein
VADTLGLMCEAYAAHSRGDQARAEEIYRSVLADEPDHPDALRLLGAALSGTARPYDALPYLERALRLNPDLPSIWLDLGQAVQCTSSTNDRMADGLAYTTKGLTMAPDLAAAHWNAALGLLALGEWQPGWKEYEYGYLCGKRALRTKRGVLWKGEEVGPDKTLFVYWEQGYGDTLCWLRLLPLLKERTGGARIVLEVQWALYPLLQACKGAIEAADEVFPINIEEPEALPAFDFRTSLLSLPYRLDVTPENVYGAPYITGIAPERLEGSGALKVGVCWRGNPDHENDRNRSMEAGLLEPLFGSARLYSLQWGERPPADSPVIEVPLTGFDRTAAIIAGLDLVVTVDTAVAHLAGAMGKETWLMLPYSPDYRWLLEREDTPLYRSVRLFRQRTPGDWAEVVGRVAAEVRRKAESSRQ